MNLYTSVVIKHRRACVAIFLVLAVLGAAAALMVGVNYDLTEYLPEDAPSTVALELMGSEFDAPVPNARVMADGLTLAEAGEYKKLIAQTPGVQSVMWLDDIIDMRTPVEMADPDTVAEYWRDGSALYSVTVEAGRESEAYAALCDLPGEPAVSGEAASTASMARQAVSESVGAICILLPVIVMILILTTSSWIEPVLFLAAIGVAVLLNLGTNLIFGEISFITQAISPILQMAVSLDYAIFLLSEFDRQRREKDDASAMLGAVKKSFKAIAASAATTLFGFLALIFMRFRIGGDLGMNLAKSIVFSYISTMVFLPALALLCCKLIDKTRHRRIIGGEMKNSGALLKLRIPALVLVLLLIVPCYLAQSNVEFMYSSGAPAEDSRLGRDTTAINDKFGRSTAIVVMVPRGDTARERELGETLGELEHVTGVVSYATSVGAQIPTGFLDDAVTSQFYSDNYARIILYTDTEAEGKTAFDAAARVRETVAQYYDEYYTCGESVNLLDMRDVVQEDIVKVNLIAIIAIALALVVTFRSAALPVILMFAIEAAIWINLAVPYFEGNKLIFIGYLVINTVQLGATIDYAILLTEGYTEGRKTLGKREAAAAALGGNIMKILTSALILASAGFCLALTSSNEIIATLGALLGRGTLLSFAMVALVLPGLLMLLDSLVRRTTMGGKNYFKK